MGETRQACSSSSEVASLRLFWLLPGHSVRDNPSMNFSLKQRMSLSLGLQWGFRTTPVPVSLGIQVLCALKTTSAEALLLLSLAGMLTK